jgi:type IV secretory pathway ATPase VirB11/archaellum biosynthesis ATPase
MAGKHVSTAFPIVDASLPGKHRLAVVIEEKSHRSERLSQSENSEKIPTLS